MSGKFLKLLFIILILVVIGEAGYYIYVQSRGGKNQSSISQKYLTNSVNETPIVTQVIANPKQID